MRSAHMLRALLITVISLAAVASVSHAQAGTATMRAHPAAAAPVPTGVQAFTSAGVCGAHPEVANCAAALSNGLVLFTWACNGCNLNWLAIFVVNGQPAALGDITLSRSKLSALSARANQFKSTDCVAIRLFDPANNSQQSTSSPLCLTGVLPAQGAAASTAMRAPAAQAMPAAQGATASTAMRAPAAQSAPAAQAVPAAGAPTPHPAPMPGGSATARSSSTTLAHGGASSQGSMTAPALNSMYVPAPKGLTNTHSQSDCNAHGGFGGGLACAAALPAGQLALVWNCPGCKANGYRLYRVDMGQHTLVPPSGAYSNDGSVSLALLVIPADGNSVHCFVVAAYRGANESSPSNSYCASSGPQVLNVTLQPQHELHWVHYRSSRTGTIGHDDKPSDSYDGNPQVGYADHYYSNSFGDVYDDYFHRTGVFFDLSSLAGRTVVVAVMQFDAQSSWHNYDNTNEHVPNLTALSPEACVVSVDKATDHWWQNNDMNSSVAYLSPGPFMGPTFEIDVTTAIRGWVGSNSSSNYGFLLKGGDENDLWHGNSNNVCLTQLQSVSLKVIYY